MENTLIHILDTKNHNILSAVTQSYILYHKWEHLKMCLDTTTDMNGTLNTVPGDDSVADIDLGYEKNFHKIRNCDNESLYISIVPSLTEESYIPIIADEDAVHNIPKKLKKPCLCSWRYCSHL